MKITVLNDNREGKCPGEHGLSFFIETDEKLKILFDLGPSDIFKKNAKLLGVNLEEVNYIVLSHGHDDHGEGLKFIKDKTLVCHPGCFADRYSRKDGLYDGLPLTLDEAKEKFQLILSKEPYHITDDIIFLGEIPRKNDFEGKTTYFFKKGGKDDFIEDDSALAIRSKKGLIIITGCSHSGICNIIEYAMKITKLKKVYAVIGGFHLRKVDDVALKTIGFLKEIKIEKLYPSHCVSDKVLNRFKEDKLDFEKVHSGDVIEL